MLEEWNIDCLPLAACQLVVRADREEKSKSDHIIPSFQIIILLARIL